ncbi:MAG: hypothetical protein WC107_03565 [Patescibacteria group bacterium]
MPLRTTRRKASKRKKPVSTGADNRRITVIVTADGQVIRTTA